MYGQLMAKIESVEAIVLNESYYNFIERLKSMIYTGELCNENNSIKKILDCYDIISNLNDKYNNAVTILVKKDKYDVIKKDIRFLHLRDNISKINIIGYRTYWEMINPSTIDLLNDIHENDLAYINDKFDDVVNNKIREELNFLNKNNYLRDTEKVCEEILNIFKKDANIYIDLISYINELKKIKILSKTIYDLIFESKSQFANRITSYNIQIDRMFNYIFKNINEDEKVIMIGDFNFDDSFYIQNCQQYDLNELYIKSGLLQMCDNYTIDNIKYDHLYLNNCKKKKFDVLKNMSELYVNSTDFRLSNIIKNENKFINSNIDRILKRITINPPFPDHNLLFASIEV